MIYRTFLNGAEIEGIFLTNEIQISNEHQPGSTTIEFFSTDFNPTIGDFIKGPGFSENTVLVSFDNKRGILEINQPIIDVLTTGTIAILGNNVTYQQCIYDSSGTISISEIMNTDILTVLNDDRNLWLTRESGRFAYSRIIQNEEDGSETWINGDFENDSVDSLYRVYNLFNGSYSDPLVRADAEQLIETLKNSYFPVFDSYERLQKFNNLNELFNISNSNTITGMQTL